MPMPDNRRSLGKTRNEAYKRLTMTDHIYLRPHGNTAIHAQDEEISPVGPSGTFLEQDANFLLINCTSASNLYLPIASDMDSKVIDIENSGTATISLYVTTSYATTPASSGNGNTLSLTVTAGRHMRVVSDGSNWIKLDDRLSKGFRTPFMDMELNSGTIGFETKQHFSMEQYDYTSYHFPEAYAKIAVDVYLVPYGQGTKHQYDQEVESSYLNIVCNSAVDLGLPKPADMAGIVLEIVNEGSVAFDIKQTSAYSTEPITDTSAKMTAPDDNRWPPDPDGSFLYSDAGPATITTDISTSATSVMVGYRARYACDGTNWYEISNEPA